MAKVRKLTTAKALQTLKQIAAERPNYRYNPSGNKGCSDFKQGRPSCIVGHFVDRLGYTYADLRSATADGCCQYSVDNGATSTLEALAAAGAKPVNGDDFDTIADMLSIAQGAQDGGKTWGEAVRRAELIAKGHSFFEVTLEDYEATL